MNYNLNTTAKKLQLEHYSKEMTRMKLPKGVYNTKNTERKPQQLNQNKETTKEIFNVKYDKKIHRTENTSD